MQQQLLPVSVFEGLGARIFTSHCAQVATQSIGLFVHALRSKLQPYGCVQHYICAQAMGVEGHGTACVQEA